MSPEQIVRNGSTWLWEHFKLFAYIMGAVAAVTGFSWTYVVRPEIHTIAEQAQADEIDNIRIDIDKVRQEQRVQGRKLDKVEEALVAERRHRDEGRREILRSIEQLGLRIDRHLVRPDR